MGQIGKKWAFLKNKRMKFGNNAKCIGYFSFNFEEDHTLGVSQDQCFDKLRHIYTPKMQ